MAIYIAKYVFRQYRGESKLIGYFRLIYKLKVTLKEIQYLIVQFPRSGDEAAATPQCLQNSAESR